jgi:hypothetical protein
MELKMEEGEMGKKVAKYTKPLGKGVEKKGKETGERGEREAAEAATKAAAQADAEKKEKERQAALEAEEAKRRKGARYGKRGMPVTEYLGETQPGYRRTLLGS